MHPLTLKRQPEQAVFGQGRIPKSVERKRCLTGWGLIEQVRPDNLRTRINPWCGAGQSPAGSTSPAVS